jgi:polyisoprenoid-binding protein YceI
MKSLLGTGRRWRWAAIAAFGGAVAIVGVPYLFTTLIVGGAPAPLTGNPTQAMRPAVDPAGAPSRGRALAADSGIWRVTSGSQAGYRVNQSVMGRGADVVGRTPAVKGEARVDGPRLTKGSFSVDLTKIESDHDRRDAHFHDHMDTLTFPTATFALSEPVDISEVGAAGAPATVSAKGHLTLRGTTRPVTVNLAVQRADANVHVRGSIPVKLADWNIPSPRLGPVMSIDHSHIEFALVLARA